MFAIAIDAPRSAPRRFTLSGFSSLAGRRSPRTVVVECNPQQILAAEIARHPQGHGIVSCATEFDRADVSGLTTWLEERAWLPAVCSLLPERAIVHREMLQPERVAEPEYLADVVEEHQRGLFLSATPFKVMHPERWTLRAVDPLTGLPLPTSGAAQPGLVCAMANDEILDFQQRLPLRSTRIESGLLSLFSSVYSMMASRGNVHAVAIVVVHQVATTVYILGKDGVHAPAPLLHGFSSIVDVARKELGLADHSEVRHHLREGHPLLRKQADKLVRRIGRDLKPLIDSYEMTTGEPVDEIFSACLPPTLAWIAEPLAKVAGRTAMTVDFNAWLSTAGLQLGDDCPALGSHWLGALGLAANLPEAPRRKSDGLEGDDAIYNRAWHVNFRHRAAAAERKAANRRLLTGVVAAALLVFTAAITGWQLYVTRSLSRDLSHWEQQMVKNGQLFTELTAANTKLKAESARLQQASDLMQAPYQLSELILNLGRTIPPYMRVDKIETNDSRAAISGALLQPAEDATATLRRYMDELRRNPSIGPLFSSIAITSLERRPQGDAVNFEITLRNHPLTRP
jgi:hypothetical protein